MGPGTETSASTSSGARPLPLLVLDVDGVLNPYAMHGSTPESFQDFSVHEARGFELRLSPAMGRSLVRLQAELCWATTWADTVDRDVAPYCDLPPGLRVAARPPEEPAALLTNWKLVQVRRLVEASRRPFVWVDDDALDWAGPDGVDARSWAAGCPVPHLLVAPHPATGLTPRQVEEIGAFLDALVRAPAESSRR